MKRMKKTVFFDLYATLVYEEATTRFYEELASYIGVEKEHFLKFYKTHGADTMRGLYDGMAGRVEATLQSMGLPVPNELKKNVEELQPLYDESIVLYPDAIATLKSLRRQGYRLGLISNASSYSEPLLASLGLADLLDDYVLSYRTGILKPSPLIYLEACQRMAVSPSSCIYVGDGGDEELRGAKSTGFKTILIDRGLAHTVEAMRYADVVVLNLTDILADAVLELKEVTYG